jgi:hypothetical protein
VTMADDTANDPATSTDDEQLVPLLREVHDKLQRPETINLALHNYAMTEIANAIVAQGLDTSGQIDLPITAISRVIEDAPEHDSPVTTTCTFYAISVFGHQVVQWSTCVSTSTVGGPSYAKATVTEDGQF